VAGDRTSHPLSARVLLLELELTQPTAELVELGLLPEPQLLTFPEDLQ